MRARRDSRDRVPADSRRHRSRSLIHCDRVDEFLAMLGFARIGEVVDHDIVYDSNAAVRAGDDGAVYVFLNPDGRAWKVGMTRRGFARVDYTRVFDGRAMKRPHEQQKLESIRREVKHGATQWVLRTDEPELVETLLACLLDPIESGRQRSKAERMLRRHAELARTSRHKERPSVPQPEER